MSVRMERQDVQIAPTLKETIHVVALMDTLAMAKLALVCHYSFSFFFLFVIDITFLSFILDVNECFFGKDNCNYNAYCNNTEGNFTCTCNIGFTGDGVTCTGIFSSFLIF